MTKTRLMANIMKYCKVSTSGVKKAELKAIYMSYAFWDHDSSGSHIA